MSPSLEITPLGSYAKRNRPMATGVFTITVTAIGAVGAGGAVLWAAWPLPRWAVMWLLAAISFFALKAATLRGWGHGVRTRRVLAYFFSPAMNAAGFLGSGAVRKGELGVGARNEIARPPARSEVLLALGKCAAGVGLAGWAVIHAHDPREMLVAWVGMLGLIFMLHFGALHAVSWIWRRAGFDAPPIMRAPIAATSLAELWGARWNTAFAEAARRFVLRPLGRRWGARNAGAVVFLVSGLAHEFVISLPAGGGWGGPTTYFLLQAGGAAFEKGRTGRRWGLGRGVRGWAWTFLFAVAPLPLLFHGPFARDVIVPFYKAIAKLLLP